MINGRRWCPESTFINSRTPCELNPMRSFCPQQSNAGKSRVTWNECPHPPPRLNTRHQAARQYIDYCNGVNHASPGCCLHSDEQPSSVISLQEVLAIDQTRTVQPHVDEDTLIEVVQRATTDMSRNNYNYYSTQPRIEDHANYYCVPRPPSRTTQEVMRSRSRQAPSARRWVEVCEDDQGRAIDLTVVRSNTPQRYRPAVISRPSPSCDVTHHVTADRVDEMIEAKRALLAIYQAGKADERFHIRAPSTRALQSMLAALSAPPSDQCTHYTAGRLLDQRQTRCQHVSCQRAGDNVEPCRRVAAATLPSSSSIPATDADGKSVKVQVECAPNTDTTVSFRVRSVPA